jgi:hypothetical protein
MGKRKSRRKEAGTFDILAEESLESLEKIRNFLIMAESITASLHSLMGSYRAMQADGSLQKLLSVVNDIGDSDEISED